MARSPVPRLVVVNVVREQGGEFVPSRAICPSCRNRGVHDPHHWLLKRSSHVPDEIINTEINIVMLCHECHNRDGQTRAMTKICYDLKVSLGYDPEAWLDELEEKGLIHHRPTIWTEEIL